MMDIDSDKKKEHNANKEIEELISSTRKLKKERMEFVEQEQKQLSEMKSVLDILDEIREK